MLWRQLTYTWWFFICLKLPENCVFIFDIIRYECNNNDLPGLESHNNSGGFRQTCLFHFNQRIIWDGITQLNLDYGFIILLLNMPKLEAATNVSANEILILQVFKRYQISYQVLMGLLNYVKMVQIAHPVNHQVTTVAPRNKYFMFGPGDAHASVCFCLYILLTF